MTDAELRRDLRTLAAWFPDEQTFVTWLWECTPVPCGFPSAEQLDEGLRIATGELALDELRAHYDAEMRAVLEACE